MKIGIVANCQVQPLAKLLSALYDVQMVVPVPTHQFGTKHFEKPDEAFKRLVQEPDAIVLSYNHESRFNEYSTLLLKHQVPRFYSLTNIHFAGLHPDIIYVGDQGGRIQSPLGDYHSKIILHSFLTGRSQTDCLQRFSGNEYERLGYYHEFEKAATELRSRDSHLDIPFAENFIALLIKTPCLYTLNHPTPAVFQEYILFIATHLGLKAQRQPIALLPNYLAHSTWWPIYDEIAETHNLSYRMPMLFKQPDAIGGKLMELEQLICASYQIYEKIRNRLSNSRQASALLAGFPE
ncbi:MAG: WcbI family polysaccharide biosynthesis putative acetyltransferase [Methylovulum sp.]|nr:WcbI family polysaccharide biosynthesis putative acetyltransferase [Methylovulum sp.]